jgi:hypothetical protein
LRKEVKKREEEHGRKQEKGNKKLNVVYKSNKFPYYCILKYVLPQT